MLPVFYVHQGRLKAVLNGAVIIDLDANASDFQELLQKAVDTHRISDALFSSTVDYAAEEGAPAELGAWIEAALDLHNYTWFGG